MQITLKLKQQLDVGNVRKASVSFALSDSSELLLLRPPHCVAATGSDMSAARRMNDTQPPENLSLCRRHGGPSLSLLPPVTMTQPEHWPVGASKKNQKPNRSFVCLSNVDSPTNQTSPLTG